MATDLDIQDIEGGETSVDGAIKRRRGVKKFIPTEDQRETVVGLKAVGTTDERIAQILGISADTLTKHFRYEIENGLKSVLARIANNLFRQALNGDTTAAIFILKTRAKWSERIEIDQINQPNVLVIDTSDRRPLDDYTDEELLGLATSPEPPPGLH